MPDKNQESPETFVAIVECPLLRDSFEFEYQAGDLVSELHARLGEVWGLPQGLRDSPLQWVVRTRWGREGARWTILCQDEIGGYSLLGETAPIPTCSPSAPGTSLEPIAARRARSWHPKLGLWLRTGVVLPQDSFEGRSLHLDLQMSPSTPTDHDQGYSVRLVALVVISGG